jgi:hypothetical protein
MNLAPDTTLVRNPERTTALARLREHEQTVTELEQKIGQHHTTTSTDTNPAETLCMLQADLYTARADTLTARKALKPIPAKLPASTIDPDATRATPRVNRRALHTVCRLLAYNAELDLARAINTYLADPDEYRAITRHLLHQPGHIHYTPTSITVTIDQPHAPRIARALNLLINQINNQPPKLAGAHRQINYQTTANLDIRPSPTTGDLKAERADPRGDGDRRGALRAWTAAARRYRRDRGARAGRVAGLAAVGEVEIERRVEHVAGVSLEHVDRGPVRRPATGRGYGIRCASPALVAADWQLAPPLQPAQLVRFRSTLTASRDRRTARRTRVRAQPALLPHMAGRAPTGCCVKGCGELRLRNINLGRSGDPAVPQRAVFRVAWGSATSAGRVPGGDSS